MQIWKMREPASEVSENSIAKFADRCTTKITQSLLKIEVKLSTLYLKLILVSVVLRIVSIINQQLI